MATIKNHTDIEQSRKLAKFLSHESADMWYWEWPTAPRYNNYERPMPHKGEDIVNVPCWSLSALLSVLPKYIGSSILRMDIGEKDFAIWYDNLSGIVDEILPDITKDNPVDACYEMICRLKENNMI